MVSVIVPTKNSGKFLSACLQSIVEQTYHPIELIVVDNWSTDQTVEIARGYTSKVYSWGPERSAQVNYGVRQAAGEFIYKVDSDFLLEPTVVAQCVNEANRGFDAVVVHNTPDARVSWIARVRKFEVDMYKYDLTHSSARFVRKSVYDGLRGFSEEITAGEDYDFQNRLNRSGYLTGFISAEAMHLGEPISLVSHLRKYYRYGADFTRYRAANKEAARRQLAFFRRAYLKNWRRFIRHPLIGITFIGYDLCKFAVGGAGYVRSKYLTRRIRIISPSNHDQ
jgi:glycosyltransferase involved in cell wall biosynthesis